MLVMSRWTSVQICLCHKSLRWKVISRHRHTDSVKCCARIAKWPVWQKIADHTLTALSPLCSKQQAAVVEYWNVGVSSYQCLLFDSHWNHLADVHWAHHGYGSRSVQCLNTLFKSLHLANIVKHLTFEVSIPRYSVFFCCIKLMCA